MSESVANNSDPAFQVVGLGEALFDLFPTQSLLGGAPLNAAVQAHRLAATIGGEGLVVSRVGNDALGRRVRAELRNLGMSDRFIQTDTLHPTGTVNVTLDDGEPTYDIVDGVAWDWLELDAALGQLAEGCSAVCYGTLAQRHPEARTAVRGFLKRAANAVRLFDVNLRQQYYDAELLRASLEFATAVKLNEYELGVIARELNLSAQDAGPSETPSDRLAAELLSSFDLRLLALTQGERGTVLFAPDRKVTADPPDFPLAPDGDHVGAGDACCAGLLIGLINDWPLPATLHLANQMGAYVASQAGATPPLPDSILALVAATKP